MAVVASVVSSRVIARLASRGVSVVAGEAWRCDSTVIDARVIPSVGDVTVVAGVAGGDVVAGFAGRGTAIVAGHTGPCDRAMVKAHVAPT